MMPCSRAALTAWRAPGSGGKIDTDRPIESAMTCTFSQWALYCPE